MREAMIKCNGVVTQVVVEGPESTNKEDMIPSDAKSVIITVPGNPGLPEFYKEFISAVHSKVPADTPTVVVGHAGHVQPSGDLADDMPDIKKWKEYYGLAGQLKHKEAFINTFVPKDANLYLIGHSIGSWFILNLLRQQLIAQRVVKCYMLFPTIEHMAESPNGKFFTGIVSRISRFLGLLVWMFAYFPTPVQVFFIRTFGIFYGIPGKHTKAVCQLLNPYVLGRVFRLAREEMRYVEKLDDELVSAHADKLWLYYGATDGWAPVKYYDKMRSKHPNVDAELCKLGFQHSFVLKSATAMGHMVGELINESITKT